MCEFGLIGQFALEELEFAKYVQLGVVGIEVALRLIF